MKNKAVLSFKETLKPLALLSFLLILFSCGTGGNRKEAALDSAVSPEAMSFQEAPDNKIDMAAERKLIKTGEIRFETSDIDETDTFLRKTVAGTGGYIVNDDAYSNEQRITHRLIVRLPADRFDEFIRKISEKVDKFDSRNINVQDVTEEYIDVETRIRTKKEIEKRYMELLRQAKTVEDILSIEKELGTIRTEIESVEGRLKYLRDQVGMSTLTIEFWEKAKSSFGYGSKIGQALATGWDLLLAFLIGLIHFWPFILVVLGIIWLVRRSSRRERMKKTG